MLGRTLIERRGVTVSGIVQGVGFRPYVHRLAQRHRLGGFVINCGGTVQIQIEGAASSIRGFIDELERSPPPLANVEEVVLRKLEPCGEREFRIEPSLHGGRDVLIPPDAATCDACLAELFDPADRRYRYPFINCTNCGPRLTIIRGAPYDRPRTTMAGFRMCTRCRAEYEDGADRRFHAQPIACPDCGPQLRLTACGEPSEPALLREEALRGLVEAVRAGRIGAMMGLGGFHLVCDARDDAAVNRLRSRKRRAAKPFAIMTPDLRAAAAECEIDAPERTLLTSPQRPIVLLRRRRKNSIAAAVAPGCPTLGVMLPYTPLHHLLMRDLGIPVVMTSGNAADEPIATTVDDAQTRLGGIADVILSHNRPIHVRCDDTVTRVIGGWEAPVRRSRGYAPLAIPLWRKGAEGAHDEDILAVGGHLKNTFGFARGERAFLSHHIGDLDHLDARRAFERDVALYEELLSADPAVIACDLHPDYASTGYALKRAEREGLPCVSVQHHHAHMAACMVEHQLDEPVIGVTFDGAGYGPDGSIWGGEFLVGDYLNARREGHLRQVAMPGGEQATREPWRMAVSHLMDAREEQDAPPIRGPIAEAPRHDIETVQRMIERRVNSPRTSSAGRLFDAVAALVGLTPAAGPRRRVSYEGQAAIELEHLAARAAPDGAYPFCDDGREIDTRPLIRAVASDAAQGVEPAVIARRFHSGVARMIAATCARVRAQSGLSTVVLSGGVFLNALLSEEAELELRRAGFRVFRHHLVPAGDGGLSLGQLAVARARRRAERAEAAVRAARTSPEQAIAAGSAT